MGTPWLVAGRNKLVPGRLQVHTPSEPHIQLAPQHIREPVRSQVGAEPFVGRSCVRNIYGRRRGNPVAS